MVKSSPGLSDGGGVAQHAHSSLYLGEVTSWNNSWWLVVDANLESSGTPVDKLDGSLGLDGGNGSVDILGDHVTSEEQTAGHVLAMSWVTLHHLTLWLEARVGDLSDSELLVESFLSRDDGSVCSQGEVDSWVGHQVGLELVQINVESSVESERGGDARDDL